MSQPPCWDATQVIRVVKPDAEEIDDHIFGAIHSPTLLRLASTVDSPKVAAGAEEFIKPISGSKSRLCPSGSAG